VAGVAQVQVALEQCDQLRGDEAHLRRQLHVELSQEQQSLRGRRVEDDDGFAAQGAVLRAAEAQHVHAHVGREGPQRQVERRGRVGDAGAVEVQAHTARVRVVGEGRDLVGV
jgi:hypothetical protein